MLTANRNMVFRGVTVKVGDAFNFELTEEQRTRLLEDGYVSLVTKPEVFEVELEGVEGLDPEKKGKRK